MSASLSPGTLLGGDFLILRSLEQGGMGEIYVALQVSRGVERAVKVMHAMFESDPELRDRFEREARLASLVQSEHVARVVGAGVDDALGVPWMAMELLDGRSLGDLLRGGPLEQSVAAEVAAQLADALIATHAAGVVHRDLKPDNVFLATSDMPGVPFVVKLVDFGVAKLVTEGTTASGALGTPLYMAPEQSLVAAEIGPHTDVWAVGLLLFKMLVGCPFWRSAGDPKASVDTLWREILIDEIPPPSERAATYGRRDRIPVGFDAWFARCVARRIDARFPDARSAAAALEEVLPRPAPGSVTPVTLARSPRSIRPSGALASREPAQGMREAGARRPTARDRDARAPAPGPLRATRRAKRILIVDDDHAAASSVASYLSDRFDVSIANNGAAGLAAAKAQRPDLIITDVSMPELDGFSMVQRLRAGAPAPHPPVIFLTGCDAPIDVIHGIQSGARYYLPKPVDLADLERKCVRALAAR